MATDTGRGRAAGGGRRPEPTITWLGLFGPDCYDTPLECFPLEHRHEFVNRKELRPYDNRIDVWPKCNHNKLCVVQVYNEFQDGGRQFFRCPIGEIDDLQRKVDTLNSQLKEATPYPYTVSLIEDPLCTDVWCTCPYPYHEEESTASTSNFLWWRCRTLSVLRWRWRTLTELS
ncbi:hypothetical protein HU200_042120 [Digitaria exilis]|uniref:Uncharacterized protein n=1 Tax=Digitaria exilis TaxID=1010633 RepID=A0A835EIM3_9POAL|nr:hypothetical protein HU200_042120 [Digitaria exilis]